MSDKCETSLIVVLYSEYYRQPFSRGYERIICPVSTARDLGVYAIIYQMVR